MKRTVLIFFCSLAGLCAQESQLGADFRLEGEHLKESCGGKFSFGAIGGCAELLFTDHPLHIAVGSLAPGNGFAGGLAFVSHYTPNERWRLSWDADAVGTANGSWRAGAYMTAVLIPRRIIGITTGGAGTVKKSNISVTEYPVFHAYAENTTLNRIGFFGLGPNTRDTARSFFGMRETIVGGNVIWPFLKPLNASLFGEANGRFVNIRGSHGQASPSIEQLYSPVAAPGLLNQPAFAQFGEGVRLRPSFAADHVRLNYFLTFQEYVAGNTVYSFQRFTANLSHQFPIYAKSTRTFLPKDHNGPDDCSMDPQDRKGKCPAITRDLQGAFGLQFLYTASFIPSGHVVPFYFQPTLGGSDVNGNQGLESYQDYRFRGPNLLLLRGSFEHSVYGPFGIALMADTGRVALTHKDLDFSHLSHSYAAGLTLRAGGLPAIYFMYAWGGHEGTHTIFNVNSALLGGSPRPPL